MLPASSRDAILFAFTCFCLLPLYNSLWFTPRPGPRFVFCAETGYSLPCRRGGNYDANMNNFFILAKAGRKFKSFSQNTVRIYKVLSIHLCILVISWRCGRPAVRNLRTTQELFPPVIFLDAPPFRRRARRGVAGPVVCNLRTSVPRRARLSAGRSGQSCPASCRPPRRRCAGSFPQRGFPARHFSTVR